MKMKNGGENSYGKYKDSDEANSVLDRLNAEYQGYENSSPVLKTVKDNLPPQRLRLRKAEAT